MSKETIELRLCSDGHHDIPFLFPNLCSLQSKGQLFGRAAVGLDGNDIVSPRYLVVVGWRERGLGWLAIGLRCDMRGEGKRGAGEEEKEEEDSSTVNKE